MIITTDFSQLPTGVLAKSQIEDTVTYPWLPNDGTPVEISGASNSQISGVDDGGIDVLGLLMEANANPCCANGNKAEIRISFPEGKNEIWGRVRFKLVDPFTIGKGGALPFRIGTNLSSFTNPTSGDNFQSGLKWHGESVVTDDSLNYDDLTDTYTAEGSIENTGLAANEFEIKTYRYSNRITAQNQGNGEESNFFKNAATNIRNLFTTNTYIWLAFHFKLNDPGENNGICEIYEFGGSLLQSVQDYNWRGNNTDVAFDHVSIEAYPGGNDSTWEEGTNREIYLRYLEVVDDPELLNPVRYYISAPSSFNIDCENDGVESVTLDWKQPETTFYHTRVERSLSNTNSFEVIGRLSEDDKPWPMLPGITDASISAPNDLNILYNNWHLFVLNWTTVGSIPTYEIRWRSKLSSTWTYEITRYNEYTIGNLEEGQTYIIQIRSVDIKEEGFQSLKSPWSSPITLTLDKWESASTTYSGLTYYVSNSGNDANNGLTPGTAVQTQSKVETLLASVTGAVNVLYNRGDEWYEELVIPDISGTSASNLVRLGAYGTGDNPKFVGSEDLSQLSWTLDSGNSYYVNRTTDYASAIFIPSREERHYPVASAIRTIDNGGEGWIQDSLLNGKNYVGSQVTYRSSDWSGETKEITAHTGSTIEWDVTSSGVPNRGKEDWGYFIFNDAEFYNGTSENEWYYDSATNRLYFTTSGGAPSLDMRLPQLRWGIRIDASYVEIRDIDINYFNDGIILNGGTSNIDISYCDLRYNYNSSVFSLGNSRNSSIENNKSAYSSTGFQMESSQTALISDNRITNIMDIIWGRTTGKWVLSEEPNDPRLQTEANNRSGSGVSFKATRDNIMRYNSLDSIGYVGLRPEGTNILVEYNYINEAMKVLADGAGIYHFSGNSASIPTESGVIKVNTVKNTIGSKFGTDAPLQLKNLTYSIYHDLGTTDYEVYGNVLIDSSYGLHRVNHNNVGQNIHHNTYFGGVNHAIMWSNFPNNRNQGHSVSNCLFVLDTGDAYEVNNQADPGGGTYKPSTFNDNIYVFTDDPLQRIMEFRKNYAGGVDQDYDKTTWKAYSGESTAKFVVPYTSDYEQEVAFSDRDIDLSKVHHYRLVNTSTNPNIASYTNYYNEDFSSLTDYEYPGNTTFSTYFDRFGEENADLSSKIFMEFNRACKFSIDVNGSNPEQDEISPSTDFPLLTRLHPYGEDRGFGIGIHIPEDWQPDITGETLIRWNQFEAGDTPSSKNSIELRIEPFNNIGKWVLYIRGDADAVSTSVQDYDIDKRLILCPIESGWNSIIFNIKFEYLSANSPFTKLWVNGMQLVNDTDINCFNDTNAPVFYFGIYKEDWLNSSFRQQSIANGTSIREYYFDKLSTATITPSFDFTYFDPFGGAEDNSYILGESNSSMIRSCQLDASIINPPQIPVNFLVDCANATQSSIPISWTYYGLQDPNISVLVERSLDDITYAQIYSLATDTSLSYTDTGLSANTTYYYRLRAYDSVTGLYSSYTISQVCTTLASSSLPVGCTAEYSTNGGGLWTPQLIGSNSITVPLTDFKTNGIEFRVNCTTCIEDYGNVIFPDPIANIDTISTEVDNPVTIQVLSNDVYQCQPIVTIFTQPSNGIATVVGDDILYTPNASYQGSDSLYYRLEECTGQQSQATLVNISVDPPTPSTSVFTIDQKDVDNIVLDFTNSTDGTTNTGGTSGTHKILFTLEGGSRVVELEKVVGTTITSEEVSLLSTIGLVAQEVAFNGILTLSKNPTQDQTLAASIAVEHSYKASDKYSDPTSDSICKFGITSFETESKAAGVASGPTTLPTWPVGGISQLSDNITLLRQSNRYRLNNIKSDTWKVIGWRLPCGGSNLEEDYPLTVNSESSLQKQISLFVQSKINEVLRFKNHSEYQDTVDHNASFYSTGKWSCDCSPNQDYFVEIEHIESGENFRIRVTKSQVIAR